MGRTRVAPGIEESCLRFLFFGACGNFQLSDINIDAINLPTYNRITTNQPLTAGIDLNYRFGL
jgi:hypothetical protein